MGHSCRIARGLQLSVSLPKAHFLLTFSSIGVRVLTENYRVGVFLQVPFHSALGGGLLGRVT